MNITADTRVILRLHTEANERGLSMYNEYFETQRLNAVYLLTKNLSATPLVSGLRQLGFAGAVAAGFEHDPSVLTLVDEVTDEARAAGVAGIIINNNGRLVAHYQGGESLHSAINEQRDVTGLNVALVGAGKVAETLLYSIAREETKPNITIYNRTIEHAQALRDKFPFVIGVGSLEDFAGSIADAAINTTSMGDAIAEHIDVASLQTFQLVADVTLGTERGGLIESARQAGVPHIITGQDMFTHQAAVVLRRILGHETNIAALRECVLRHV